MVDHDSVEIVSGPTVGVGGERKVGTGGTLISVTLSVSVRAFVLSLVREGDVP